MNKIVQLSLYKASSGKTVAVSGCFDILHIGHIRLLAAAKQYGDNLVVLLESDEFITTYKKRQPFHSQTERAEMLSHIIEVDMVVLLPFMKDSNDYQIMWQQIRPNLIAITKGDLYVENKRKQAALIGAEIVEATSLIAGFSSTEALTHHPSKSITE